MDNTVIIEDWSPVADIQAFVEKGDKNYYFYFWIHPIGPDSEIRSCWICNRITAPSDVEEAFAVENEAPCMPAEFVNHDINGMDLEEESLFIEWFEEGDAAALLSEDKIVAVIPCFSGYKGFHGYSIYANGTGPFAWELKGAYPRREADLKRSREFWAFFDKEDYWGNVQDFHENVLKKFFGKEEKYYAIDGGEFPPKALVTGRKDNILYAFTLGVSMIPMPKVEMSYGDEYKEYRRMELGFACDERHEKLLELFFSTMSWLTSYPWKDLTFFGHGHTIPFRNIKGKDYLLFLNDRFLMIKDKPKYDDFMDEKINLLWLVPISSEDREFIVEKGIEEYLKGKDLSDIHIFGKDKSKGGERKMGLFNIFKGDANGKGNADFNGIQGAQERSNPFAKGEETLDSFTWLEDVKHSMNGSWHVFDVTFFAGEYDWNHVRNNAEYTIMHDLTKVVEVKVADTAEYNITEEFMQYGSLLSTPSLDREYNVMSVAGFSKVLNKNMMVIWFTNARVMKFITDLEDETLLKKYAETLLRENFGTENAMKMGKPFSI